MEEMHSYEQFSKTPTQASRLREIFGLIALTFGALLFLSLLTYHPEDPSWNLVGQGITRNAAGPVGAYLSDIFLQLFGIGAYFIVFLAFLCAFMMILQRRIAFRWISLVGYACIGLLISSFFHLWWGYWGPHGYSTGGAAGQWLATLLVSQTGRGGTYLLLTMMLALSVVWTTQFSFVETGSRIAERMSPHTRRWALGLHERFLDWRDAWARWRSSKSASQRRERKPVFAAAGGDLPALELEHSWLEAEPSWATSDLRPRDREKALPELTPPAGVDAYRAEISAVKISHPDWSSRGAAPHPIEQEAETNQGTLRRFASESEAPEVTEHIPHIAISHLSRGKSLPQLKLDTLALSVPSERMNAILRNLNDQPNPDDPPYALPHEANRYADSSDRRTQPPASNGKMLTSLEDLLPISHADIESETSLDDEENALHTLDIDDPRHQQALAWSQAAQPASPNTLLEQAHIAPSEQALQTHTQWPHESLYADDAREPHEAQDDHEPTLHHEPTTPHPAWDGANYTLGQPIVDFSTHATPPQATQHTVQALQPVDPYGLLEAQPIHPYGMLEAQPAPYGMLDAQPAHPYGMLDAQPAHPYGMLDAQPTPYHAENAQAFHAQQAFYAHSLAYGAPAPLQMEAPQPQESLTTPVRGAYSFTTDVAQGTDDFAADVAQGTDDFAADVAQGTDDFAADVAQSTDDFAAESVQHASHALPQTSSTTADFSPTYIAPSFSSEVTPLQTHGVTSQTADFSAKEVVAPLSHKTTIVRPSVQSVTPSSAQPLAQNPAQPLAQNPVQPIAQVHLLASEESEYSQDIEKEEDDIASEESEYSQDIEEEDDIASEESEYSQDIEPSEESEYSQDIEPSEEIANHLGIQKTAAQLGSASTDAAFTPASTDAALTPASTAAAFTPAGLAAAFTPAGLALPTASSVALPVAAPRSGLTILPALRTDTPSFDPSQGKYEAQVTAKKVVLPTKEQGDLSVYDRAPAEVAAVEKAKALEKAEQLSLEHVLPTLPKAKDYEAGEEVLQLRGVAQRAEPPGIAQATAAMNGPLVQAKARAKSEDELQQQSKPAWRLHGYQPPSIDLLDYVEQADDEDDDLLPEFLVENARVLEKTLETFGIKGEVQQILPGPVITMYEYLPAPGIKVSRIAGLADNLAMSLAAVQVRILAPIPGKNCVGIELPNRKREVVYIKELLADERFQKTQAKLPMAMGKDTTGTPYIANLAKMPHLLIAGTTGSGKSVGVNSMIVSLLYHASPEDVRFIMIDPKMLELSIYDGIPHLLLPVVTDAKKAATALAWAVNEMERRYSLMAEAGVRNINNYNGLVEQRQKARDLIEQREARRDMARREALRDDEILEDDPAEMDWENSAEYSPDELYQSNAPKSYYEKMPYIVVIIDELADLMMVAAKEVEFSIARLAQMARAAGIHLMLATQRPSVDVLTGVIKANFPSRCAFQLKSKIDSRTILDQPGAERLLGQGDMLLTPPSSSAPVRIHGCYVSEEEVHRVVNHLKKQGEPEYNADIIPTSEAQEEGEEFTDDMYDKAIEIVVKSRNASISALQRKLRIGYNRAARMIEQMAREGIVGEQIGSKPREILAPEGEY